MDLAHLYQENENQENLEHFNYSATRGTLLAETGEMCLNIMSCLERGGKMDHCKTACPQVKILEVTLKSAIKHIHNSAQRLDKASLTINYRLDKIHEVGIRNQEKISAMEEEISLHKKDRIMRGGVAGILGGGGLMGLLELVKFFTN